MMTTKLKHIKSYPTYQLHTYTNNKRLPAEEVLKICILETMKWLRSRLSLFSDIPTQLDLPDSYFVTILFFVTYSLSHFF